MINLFIPIEFLARDFNHKLHFAYKIKNNFNIILGEQNELLRIIYKYRPGIYFDKSCSINKHKLYKRLHSIGWKIVVIDAEGLGIYTNKKNHLEKRVYKFNLDYIERYFCWSNYEYSLLKNKYPDYEHKFVNTGNPRFEFFKYLASNNKKNDNKNSYLISSSVIGKPKIGENALMDLHRSMKRINTIDDEITYIERRKNSKIQHKIYKQNITELVSKNVEKDFIIRPHPIEDIDSWFNLQRDHKNVTLQEAKINISVNFNKVEGLIHSGCTSALEASFYGLNTYFISLNNEYNFYEKLSKKINSDYVFSHNQDVSVNKEFKYLFNTKDSSINVLNELTNIDKFEKVISFKSYIYFIMKNILYRKKNVQDKFNINNKNELLSVIYEFDRDFLVDDIKINDNGKILHL